MGSNTDMPARYCGEKTDAAKSAKLTILYTVRRALREDVRPLTWAALKAFANQAVLEAARREALVSLAADQEVIVTAQEKLKGLVAPRKRFKLQGLRFKKMTVPPTIKQDVVPTNKEIPGHSNPKVLQQNLVWVVTKRKGAPLIHILSPIRIPFCDRRQAPDKAKEFCKYWASGNTVGELRLMGFTLNDRCDRCWRNLDADTREKLTAALDEYR